MKTIAVAYVTKWTGSILIVKNAEAHEERDIAPGCLSFKHALIRSKDWTEDKAEAEKRWAQGLAKKRKSHLKNAEAVTDKLAKPPVYTKR